VSFRVRMGYTKNGQKKKNQTPKKNKGKPQGTPSPQKFPQKGGKALQAAQDKTAETTEALRKSMLDNNTEDNSNRSARGLDESGSEDDMFSKADRDSSEDDVNPVTGTKKSRKRVREKKKATEQEEPEKKEEEEETEKEKGKDVWAEWEEDYLKELEEEKKEEFYMGRSRYMELSRYAAQSSSQAAEKKWKVFFNKNKGDKSFQDGVLVGVMYFYQGDPALDLVQVALHNIGLKGQITPLTKTPNESKNYKVRAWYKGGVENIHTTIGNSVNWGQK
jgi:hypothetical protein